MKLCSKLTGLGLLTILVSSPTSMVWSGSPIGGNSGGISPEKPCPPDRLDKALVDFANITRRLDLERRRWEGGKLKPIFPELPSRATKVDMSPFLRELETHGIRNPKEMVALGFGGQANIYRVTREDGSYVTYRKFLDSGPTNSAEVWAVKQNILRTLVERKQLSDIHVAKVLSARGNSATLEYVPGRAIDEVFATEGLDDGIRFAIDYKYRAISNEIRNALEDIVGTHLTTDKKFVAPLLPDTVYEIPLVRNTRSTFARPAPWMRQQARVQGFDITIPWNRGEYWDELSSSDIRFLSLRIKPDNIIVDPVTFKLTIVDPW